MAATSKILQHLDAWTIYHMRSTGTGSTLLDIVSAVARTRSTQTSRTTS